VDDGFPSTREYTASYGNGENVEDVITANLLEASGGEKGV
jgi:hypothetical protein